MSQDLFNPIPEPMTPETFIHPKWSSWNTYETHYKTRNTRNRCWVLTHNNYQPEDWDMLKSWYNAPKSSKRNTVGEITYMCLSKEVGECGTPHIQGFIVFKNQVKWKTLMNRIRCYWDPKYEKATCEHNRNYVGKFGDKWTQKPTPLEFWEAGTMPMSAAERSKKGGEATKEMWQNVIQLAKENNFQDLAVEQPEIMVKHIGNLQKVRTQLQERPRDLAPGTKCGIWIMGVPGTGKSHHVKSVFPSHKLFWKSLNKWWCGWQPQHKYAFLDDVGAEQATWIGYFLKIWTMEGAFQAEMKGASQLIRPELIIVTSNSSIQELFGNHNDSALVDALYRRFTVIKFNHPDHTKDKVFTGRCDEEKLGFDMSTIAIKEAVLPSSLVDSDDSDNDEPTIILNNDDNESVPDSQPSQCSSNRYRQQHTSNFNNIFSAASNFNMPPSTPIRIDSSIEVPETPAKQKEREWLWIDRGGRPGRRLVLQTSVCETPDTSLPSVNLSEYLQAAREMDESLNKNNV
nr:rep protein [Cressdnaviricota sp.]